MKELTGTILLGILWCTLGSRDSQLTAETRIVGGNETTPNEFQHQVFVGGLLRTGNLICAGSILNPNFILTAAHCVHNISVGKIRILAGRHLVKDKSEKSEQSSAVDVVIVHSCYESDSKRKKNFRNDIALIKLKTPLIFNEFVGSIQIDEKNRARPFGKVTIVGWGRTNVSVSESFSNPLKRADLTVSGQGECEVDFPFLHKMSQFCAVSDFAFACQGDSGGPLICNEGDTRYLCGITSFVSADGCTKTPSAYTRVSYFKGWINGVIRNGKESSLDCIKSGFAGSKRIKKTSDYNFILITISVILINPLKCLRIIIKF